MKIFIDFDDTIFNTKKFKHDLIGIFLKHGVTLSDFENSYYGLQKLNKTKGLHYDPKAQIQVLKKNNIGDSKKLGEAMDIFLAKLETYVFGDVLEFLQMFPRKDLFILSYGHDVFQRKKIKGAGILSLVHRVIVDKNNKIELIMQLARKYAFSSKEDIILIDDRSEQLSRTKKSQRRVRTFHICRKEGRYSNLICLEKDYAAKNLREVRRIIKKENLK